MIPVIAVEEPEGFDEACRKAGTTWLQNSPNAKRPRDFWSPFRLKLAEAFKDRCGFGAMWISSGTVDHFMSCHEDKNLAYEWSNYRYVEGWLNSSKSKKRAEELLDPFSVADGWFEIVLPSMQMVVSQCIPEPFRALAERTLTLLPLRDDERILRTRRQWLEAYEKGMPLEVLREKAPLIAIAVEKRDLARKLIGR
ncbi:hypothetical protein [Pseudomonas parafulva]|uniref:hypothetical protein n=1 Tax=Pseudomonas parafulva TaxID=157782 RepID=UPI000540D96A|nr:hypothetical protein [Pseudomonas parafulva]AIZ34586.1 hypothetical protein NJ69_17070 [Pseudomonas parafulva]